MDIESFGFFAGYSFILGIPIAALANAGIAAVVNHFLRLQRKSLFAVAVPSLLAPVVLVAIITFFLVLSDYSSRNLSPLVSYVRASSILFLWFSLVTTVPQLVTHGILRRKRRSDNRVLISAALGCAMVVLLVLGFAVILI